MCRDGDQGFVSSVSTHNSQCLSFDLRPSPLRRRWIESFVYNSVEITGPVQLIFLVNIRYNAIVICVCLCTTCFSFVWKLGSNNKSSHEEKQKRRVRQKRVERDDDVCRIGDKARHTIREKDLSGCLLFSFLPTDTNTKLLVVFYQQHTDHFRALELVGRRSIRRCDCRQHAGQDFLTWPA